MIIAIDFDGTCVTHAYPSMGKDIGAAPVLKSLVERGHQLILFTMRSGQTLDDAVAWFAKHDIPLYGINTNPSQASWTTSPKALADMYIDDAALGAPLTHPIVGRPYINWAAVKTLLLKRFISI
jgi:hypothetical protein